MSRTRSLCFVVFAASAGCAAPLSFTPTATGGSPRPPRTPEQVQVFLVAKPDRPFVELGLVEYGTNDEPIEHLRRKAAEVGCEAIVLMPNDDKTIGFVALGIGAVLTADKYRASCIAFVDRGNG